MRLAAFVGRLAAGAAATARRRAVTAGGGGGRRPVARFAKGLRVLDDLGDEGIEPPWFAGFEAARHQREGL